MRRGIAGVAVSVLAALATLSSCGTDTTPTGFCETFDKQHEAYVAEYGMTPEHALEAAVNMQAAVESWIPMLKQLENSAPPVLAPDMASVRNSFESVDLSITDNLSGIVRQTPFENFALYVASNCGSDGAAQLAVLPSNLQTPQPEDLPSEEPYNLETEGVKALFNEAFNNLSSMMTYPPAVHDSEIQNALGALVNARIALGEIDPALVDDPEIDELVEETEEYLNGSDQRPSG